ncbi:MAG: biotin synthase BioB [Pirellulaceae bacterium]|nr:biotin synthase BioB [Pirellulaceae bacterium]
MSTLHESPTTQSIRNDWTREEVTQLFDLSLMDLVFQAQSVHRQHFDPNEVQLSTLLNIKQGGCSEDCKYCSQSARYQTGIDNEKLMDKDRVLQFARQAKANGSGRFCMGAAWRNVKNRNMDELVEIVQAVKDLGMETCMTLGMLSEDQAQQLADAGLDYYNHNIDTSREFYPEVVTTRSYDDRLDTLENVRSAGMHVCCGGIIGMGEAREDRGGLLHTLATLPAHPGSVPINMLVPVAGTPMGDREMIDPLELVRTIAVARILMPASYVRLSAGRRSIGETGQALCFLAGANSIFYGDKLLTTPNPEETSDMALLAKLGMKTTGEPVASQESSCESDSCGCG